MWAFLPWGFFSAVEDRADASKVYVRSRSRKELVTLVTRLAPKPRIKASPDADYPFRVHVSKAAWGAFLGSFVESELRYDNFKDAAANAREPANIHHLHEVWATLRRAYEEQRGSR